MKVILCGYGKMGHAIEELLLSQGHEIVGIVHPGMLSSPQECPARADVVIDFSYPGNVPASLAYVREHGAALVLGTTGLTLQDEQAVSQAAEGAAILRSSNFSLGVALMKRACAMLAKSLMPAFDCEIVETHHNQKVDAPSGTAKALLSAVDPDDEYDHVFGREGVTGRRGHEIGVHALRGGTIAGIHTVSFFGEDEVLEIKHTAVSRRIFAVGAVRAAVWLCQKGAGLYSMDDVIAESEA